MNYNIATILAVIAIIFVLVTYITTAPLVPVAVILLGAGDYFRGTRKRKFEKQLKNSEPLGDRAERPDSATLLRDDLRLFMRSGTGTRISFATGFIRRDFVVHEGPDPNFSIPHSNSFKEKSRLIFLPNYGCLESLSGQSSMPTGL